MRITIKIGIICAVIWMLLKYVYHMVDPVTTNLKPTILSNMLLLVSAISVGLYLHKKEEGFSQGNALSDIKAALTSGVIYTVLACAFIYSYYSFINPDFNAHQLSEIKQEIKREIESTEGLKKIKASQSAFEVMTKKQIYKELVKGPESFYTARSTFVISLLSLLLLSTLYSILVTVIFRKVLLRNMNR